MELGNWVAIMRLHALKLVTLSANRLRLTAFFRAFYTTRRESLLQDSAQRHKQAVQYYKAADRISLDSSVGLGSRARARLRYQVSSAGRCGKFFFSLKRQNWSTLNYKDAPHSHRIVFVSFI